MNSLGIVETFSITQEEKEIHLTASIVLPQKEASTSHNQYKLVKSSGDSLGEAFLNLQEKENKKIYFDQTQILLLDRTILQNHIEELIPFLLSHFKHPNLLTFLCDDCESILKKEKDKSFYESLVKSKHTKTGSTAITTFEDFAALYLDKDITAYLPLLSIENNEVTLSSLIAITNDLKFVPFESEEAKTFFLLKEKISAFEESILLNKKTYSMTLSKLQSKIKEKDGSVTIEIQARYKENDILNAKQKKKVTKLLEQKLTKEIEAFLQKEAFQKTDLLGIQNLFLKTTRNREKAKRKKVNATYKISIHFKEEGDLFDQS